MNDSYIAAPAFHSIPSTPDVHDQRTSPSSPSHSAHAASHASRTLACMSSRREPTHGEWTTKRTTT